MTSESRSSRQQGERRTAIFTICSNNYMPFAHVLLSSVRRYHPEAALFLCLADRKIDGSGFYTQDWTVIEAPDLAIPDFPSFAFRYDVMEFNTALKPFMFLRLLDEYGFDDVIYFDPDIELLAPLSPVLTLLHGGASFVLLPHLCTPNENPQEPNDISIMRAGSYNLGFLAVSRTEEATELLSWWARRLRYQCVNDQPAGIFVDQKFMDLIPSFAARATICRDTALDVAYWNLEQRQLDRTEDGWLVDGAPLIFFHFSGFDPHNLDRLSKHDPRFAGNLPEPLQKLMAEYAERLFAQGYGRFPGAMYAYGQFASGTPVHPAIRTMFRGWHAYWGSDPFEDYEAFLHEPWPEASLAIPAFTVTNFMRFLQGVVPPLRRLDPRLPEDAASLVRWFVKDAVGVLGLDTALVEPAAARLGRLRPSSAAIATRQEGGEMDVTLIAPLRRGGEPAQSGHLTFDALLDTGLAVEMLDGTVQQGADPGRDAKAPVQITCLTAVDMVASLPYQRSRHGDDTFRILIPLSNFDRFPSRALPLDDVHEIWAPSRFTQLGFAGYTDRPVIHMPLAITVDPTSARLAGQFGLPVDRFIVFSPLDGPPGMGYADPHAAIRAFRLAFPQRGRAFLILAGEGSPLPVEARVALDAEIEGDPDILLLEAGLTAEMTQGLMASCGAMLSLHQSLGVGLSIGRAMLLGRPVVATDYSASRDFLTAETGYPIGYRLASEGTRNWAEADIAHAAWIMEQLAERPERAFPLTLAGQAHVKSHYGRAAIAALQKGRLELLGLRAA